MPGPVAVASAPASLPSTGMSTSTTTFAPVVEAADQALLERLLAERSVRTVFQPLVGAVEVGGLHALRLRVGWSSPSPVSVYNVASGRYSNLR